MSIYSVAGFTKYNGQVTGVSFTHLDKQYVPSWSTKRNNGGAYIEVSKCQDGSLSIDAMEWYEGKTAEQRRRIMLNLDSATAHKLREYLCAAYPLPEAEKGLESVNPPAVAPVYPIGYTERSLTGGARITYRPDYSESLPWICYSLGEAGRHFYTLEDAKTYLKGKGYAFP